MAEGDTSVEIVSSDEKGHHSPSLREKCLIAEPVSGGSSGEGLPYAPEGWPCPGDIWRWKVGNRRSIYGHWLDRYLYPPSHCPKVTGSKLKFRSRASVEDYLQKEFPNMDVNVFFSSFIWRIPCTGGTLRNGPMVGSGDCKAQNKMCSLQKESKIKALAAKDCDICCTEAGFCRECCCILCSKNIDWAYGGYSFIRCEAMLDKNHICGHVAHIECALRSYMAGTVGGNIGLDVEYYCRRCDNITDLMQHVTKLLGVCESLESRDEIEKILNVGLSILRGSEQTKSKMLKNHIESIITKLQLGTQLDEIWKVEGDTLLRTAGYMSPPESETAIMGAQYTGEIKRTMNYANNVEAAQKYEMTDDRTHYPTCIKSDHRNLSVKLEDEVDKVLRELKRSQESEYSIAEQKLYSHKAFLLSLYQQLDSERSDLVDPMSSGHGDNVDALLSSVLRRVDQIKHEEEKFRVMMRIANGFGQTRGSILREHFGLVIDD
ncbi:uncharacterized protein [Typha latifolia]|uniref:uncharacterized protein isoform X1 n=1 Tax=Typha latifolia TaxID=4733 RepID=UPI003C2C10B3